MNTPSILFWDFSLAHYAKPGVADCCLQLQNRHGVNVNLLLWSLWLEGENKLLTNYGLKVAFDTVNLWDANYVQPLRNLRRKMKREFAEHTEQIAAVREQIKVAELLAEKQEQQWLETLTLHWPTANDKIDAGKNVLFYLRYLNLPAEVIEQAKTQCCCIQQG